jgi:vitamin K-dependent gamma-carboxylase
MATELRARLNRPVPALGLAAFRALFGALMFVSVVRFAARGWIDELLVAPAFHFTYLGFDWVKPLPAPFMHAAFALMGVSALAVCVGAFTRLSALVFFITFTYAELIDKATYLNHYYFVSLLAFLLILLPSNTVASVDARLRPEFRSETVGAWAYLVLRLQLTFVYFFAGFAKLNPDWLFHAEPLRTWLFAHGDAPLVGPLFCESWVAHAMSFGGALFDLSVGFLFWRRPLVRYVYALAALFHLAVWALFPIGMFSFVMLVATTVFFEPDWPASLLSRFRSRQRPTATSTLAPARSDAGPARPLGTLHVALLGAFLLVELVVPLRFLAYPGNPNWTEDAYRFAWRVMLIEKSGSAEFRVETPRGTRIVRPREDLTELQYKMMSTQPDMIQEYARHLAKRFATPGTSPRVYADAWASLNGRPSQRLIDPTIDLAAEPRTLGPARFVVPLDERGHSTFELSRSE